MKHALAFALSLLLTVSAVAAPAGQPGSAGTTTGMKTKKKSSSSIAADSSTSKEMQQMKEALDAQQKQIQELRDMVMRSEAARQQSEQALRDAQAAAQQAQSSAAAAQQTANEQSSSIASMKSSMADVQTTLTNTAVGTQEEQKKFSTLEGLVNRFRFTGDVRVRYENFFQDSADGTTFFQPRHRERIRVRLGIEGKLNEDFLGGMALASGTLADPTSTNESLTNAFEKKTIGIDRGYITYNPVAHKWLSLTGGKFAFTWQRTSMTFDPDLNPEGFSERFSFDTKNPVFKNVTFTAMQLFFNENNGTFLGNAGAPRTDSFAVGGQVLAKLQLGKRVSMTPSFTLLNWRNGDILLNEGFSSQPGGTPLPVPSPGGTGTFAPNGMTNWTYTGADGKLHFNSRFLYADFIDTIQVKTGWEKLPFNLLLEYLNNLNAVSPCDAPNAPAQCGTVRYGDQNHAFGFEASLGQQKNKGDVQFGYAWLRQEQESAIASFNESDQRAPTNIVQNRLFFLYKIQKNTALGYTFWFGRYLNTFLNHPGAAPGLVAGQEEPKLKRMQFDVVYSF